MDATFKKYLKRAAMVWAGCFVVAILVYMAVLLPQRRIIRQLESELAEKKQLCEMAVEAAEAKTKARLTREMEQLEDLLAAFSINADESANLTLDISQIASEKNIFSMSIGGKGKVSSPTCKIPGCKLICESYIELEFTAGFHEFASFLNALERHKPVIFIDKFKIVRGGDGKNNNDVEMELAVFVRKRGKTGLVASRSRLTAVCLPPAG